MGQEFFYVHTSTEYDGVDPSLLRELLLNSYKEISDLGSLPTEMNQHIIRLLFKKTTPDGGSTFKQITRNYRLHHNSNNA